jgi:hypothetical protein
VELEAAEHDADESLKLQKGLFVWKSKEKEAEPNDQRFTLDFRGR